MASEIRVDKITSLSGVGTISPSPTGVEIAGITTVATLKATTGIVTTLTATTGIVTTLTANTVTSLGAVSGTTGTFTGDVGIADKIAHNGDENTSIRFPEADTITAQTNAAERLRIDSDGDLIHRSLNKTLSLVSTQNASQAGTKIAFFGADRYDTDEEFAAIRGLLVGNSGGSGNKQNGGLQFVIGNNSHTHAMTQGGYVGFGTGNPQADLHVSSGANTEIRIADTSATISYGRIIYNNDADNADALVIEADGGNDISGSNIRFRIDGAEKARILSTGGITFNGDTADANALDDYEEGDFTPTFEGGSGSITVSGYAVQYGKYVKIGRMVYVEGVVRGNVTNNSNGTWDLGGLPFTVTNTPNASGILHGKEQTSWTVAPDHFSCIVNTTKARARGGLTVGASAYTNGNTSGFNSGSNNNNRVYFAGWYRAQS